MKRVFGLKTKCQAVPPEIRVPLIDVNAGWSSAPDSPRPKFHRRVRDKFLAFVKKPINFCVAVVETLSQIIGYPAVYVILIVIAAIFAVTLIAAVIAFGLPAYIAYLSM